MTPLVIDQPPVPQVPGKALEEATSSCVRYRSLEENDIRLVEISPLSSDGEEISCCLRHVSLDKSLQYKALSYAWGIPGEGSQISLDGASFSVTRNLEAALRSLQHSSAKPSLIWIDALCINQDDVEERGKQVGRMRLIYQHAEEVIVWLGPECDGSPLAWQLIKDLYSCRGDSVAIANLIQPGRRVQFDALRTLFRRDYWWRIWVVQEVACAKYATVYCGSESISWEVLKTVCDVLEHARQNLRDEIYHDSPATIFSLMRGGPMGLSLSDGSSSRVRFSDEDPPRLFDLLYLHSSKLSTDPRDKVYGLVGISSSRESFGLIDYTRSVRSTYVHTAQHLITTTQNLSFICLQQNDDNIFDLPSWVPDWSRRLLYPSHRIMGLYIREPRFTASGSLVAKSSFSEDDEALTTAGFIIDTIHTSSQPLYVHGPESDVIPTLKAFYNWWCVFVTAKGSTLEDLGVFQRTFCGGAWAPVYSDFEEDQSQRITLFWGLLQRLLPEIVKDTHSPIPQSYFENKAKNADADAAALLEKRQYAMVASAALRMHSKQLVVSSSKLTGLAPMATQVGDVIAVLFGCSFPVVLRDMGGGSWMLVGEIYVDGMMYGEALEGLHSGKFIERNFEIR
jgi:hypothetical protein